MFVMVGVAFLVSTFGVVNTMLMSVMERRREIAYLKCLGARRRDVLKLIALETLVICAMGAVTGAFVGLAVAPLAGSLLRGTMVAYVPSGGIAQPSFDIAATSILLALTTGVVCALYPAWKAASIVPMEVLRNE
jgi:putative ABC transport system permease protein